MNNIVGIGIEVNMIPEEAGTTCFIRQPFRYYYQYPRIAHTILYAGYPVPAGLGEICSLTAGYAVYLTFIWAEAELYKMFS